MADAPFNNTNIKPSDITLLDIVKAIKNGTEYETRMTNLNDFFGENLSLTFEQIYGDPYLSATLGPVLEEIDKILKAHTKELLYLNRLLALLLFELIEQGIEIESKELLEELKIYLAKK